MIIEAFRKAQKGFPEGLNQMLMAMSMKHRPANQKRESLFQHNEMMWDDPILTYGISAKMR